MNTITTAIIPVAGLGTRVLPASKAIPKEMLPIVDLPVIQYVVEEAVAAGIKTIVFVTRSGKEAIENHFDSNYELESLLMQKGKTKVLKDIRNLVPEGVEIVSVRQDSPRGLGHAVLCARNFCQKDAFAVLLPDVVVYTKNDKSDLAEMVKQYNKSGIGQIMVEAVPEDKIPMYGIADCNGKNPKPFESVPIKGMVEKPSAKEAPSNLAMVGRYILPKQTMNILMDTQPDAGNEVQLTNALETLLNHQSLQAFRMHGTTFDCGNKLGYLLANVHMGMEHPEIGEGFVKALRSMLDIK